MAIYLLKFDFYAEYIKVGRSIDTLRRVRDHIKDNGKLSFLEEFSAPEGVDDKAVERELLDTFRTALRGNIKRIGGVKGWTEFVPADALDGMRVVLADKGYTKTELRIDAFEGHTCGHPFNSMTLDLEKAVLRLQIADAVILTVYQSGKHWPSTIEEFNKICEDVGTEPGWCEPMDFHVATYFKSRWPEGVIHQSIDMMA